MNRLNQAIMLIDAITETPKARAERIEEARIENLNHKEECERTDYEQGMYDSGMCNSDFL